MLVKHHIKKKLDAAVVIWTSWDIIKCSVRNGSLEPNPTLLVWRLNWTNFWLNYVEKIKSASLIMQRYVSAPASSIQSENLFSW